MFYTNLQLNSYPNTQLDLFCSNNCSFQCMAPSTWLTNRCANLNTWLTHQLTIKITKLLGYKTLRCTNIATSWRDRWTRAYVSDSQYACEKLLHWVALVVMALKQSLYMFRVVRKESLNIYTHIGVKSNLENWFF